MEIKCDKCGNIYKVKGMAVIEALSGGTECPNCKANINKIIIQKKKIRK